MDTPTLRAAHVPEACDGGSTGADSAAQPVDRIEEPTVADQA